MSPVSARFAKFELISARFAKFWVLPARFAKFFCLAGGQESLYGKSANPCSLWMNPSFKPDLSVKELLRNQIWAQRIRVAQWELVNKPHWGTVEILHFNEWIYFLALFWKSFLPICQDPECTKIWFYLSSEQGVSNELDFNIVIIASFEPNLDFIWQFFWEIWHFLT